VGSIQGYVEGHHTWGKRPNLAYHGTDGHFEKINDDYDD